MVISDHANQDGLQVWLTTIRKQLCTETVCEDCAEEYTSDHADKRGVVWNKHFLKNVSSLNSNWINSA